MEFLDCWTELTLPDLLRLLAPAVFLTVATLMPGVRIVRLCAIGVALTIPLVEELGVTPRFTLAWSALWLLIAWGSRGQEGAAKRPLAELVHADAGGISVRDAGPGVPLDDLPRLFERFWRGAHRRDLGAGLGLSICREIATAHGWEIHAHRTEPGMVFELRMSRDAEKREV